MTTATVSMLERIETSLPGVLELRPRVFKDSRGFFFENYNRNRFVELGITDVFVQDNHSCSCKNTLRGFHYQLRHPQAKLCRVVEGKALDVAVDIRVGSPFFGKWTSVLLSDEEQNMIYIPAGFAHGFLALTDRVQFLYKCSDFYNLSDEHGIIWNDPEIAVSWTLSDPILSEKDQKYPRLSTVDVNALPRFSS